MGIFSKPEPVILKEGSSAHEQLAALEALRGTLPAAAERRLETDIRAVQAGIVGEDRILYELRNSHLDMCVLQDLYLEHEGLTAQIDFLVLTPQRYFILECKNLYGDIEVDNHGNFIRSFGGRKREGIYSPITQNQRHVELIRSLKHDSRGVVANLLVGGDFDDIYRSYVVLANPKTVLKDRYAPREVRDRIIRADQLVATIQTANAEKGPGHDRASMSVVRKSAEWFLAQHKECPEDYTAKYREQADSAAKDAVAVKAAKANQEATDKQPNAASAPTEAAASAASQQVLCPKCGAPMVLRTARRGERAGKQFYGCSNYPHCRGTVNIVE